MEPSTEEIRERNRQAIIQCRRLVEETTIAIEDARRILRRTRETAAAAQRPDADLSRDDQRQGGRADDA